jgi:hypothetical protein
MASTGGGSTTHRGPTCSQRLVDPMWNLCVLVLPPTLLPWLPA